jgi:hypothetical protein
MMAGEVLKQSFRVIEIGPEEQVIMLFAQIIVQFWLIASHDAAIGARNLEGWFFSQSFKITLFLLVIPSCVMISAQPSGSSRLGTSRFLAFLRVFHRYLR